MRKVFHQMGTFVIETPLIHTRLNICNLEPPESTVRIGPVPISVRLHAPNGDIVYKSKSILAKNETLCLEASDLLPKGHNTDFYGLARINYESDQVGTLRFYTHWYNDKSLTSTHEFFPREPRTDYFASVERIVVDGRYETYLAISNIENKKLWTTLTLVGDREVLGQKEATLGPYSSTLLEMSSIFDSKAWRKGVETMVYIGALSHPFASYSFIMDKETGIWGGAVHV
jgi:hypothetical protein